MTRTSRLAFATSSRFPAVHEDDHPLFPALAERHVEAVPAVWDDPAVDWRAFDAVVVRSIWDYTEKYAAFHGWLDRLDADGATVWNRPAILRWNAHKIYLQDLAAAGVEVVPTLHIPQGAPVARVEVLREQRWPEAVVKPAVSAAARGTWRTSAAPDAQADARFDADVADHDLLVQPYLSAIETRGEWSLVYFDRVFSHAVTKRPAPGDFRVQVAHGGRVTATRPPSAVLAAAERALAAVSGPLPYARVDGVEADGRFLLMELELVEPRLYLAEGPGGVARFADVLARLVTGPGRNAF